MTVHHRCLAGCAEQLTSVSTGANGTGCGQSQTPLRPAIVTKDEVTDPHSLNIKLAIGGELLLHSNTRELIFRIPDLITYVSTTTPLQPGDIISTGTPSGVGLGRTPHRWLRPGETIITEIQGIGRLINPVIAEA